MTKCGFIRPDGRACRALPMKGEGWCYTHHPAQTERRRREGAKGGRRGGRGRPGGDKELVTIKKRLRQLADDVLEGSVERSDAAVASQVLNVFLRAVSVELKVREQQELTERIEELEQALENQKASRPWAT